MVSEISLYSFIFKKNSDNIQFLFNNKINAFLF